jgi:dihydropteroate synthase
VSVALDHGVRPEQIVIDPGHDLNKNTHHSLELTRRLADITSLGYPTLVALSNKDFIGEALGRPQHERLVGTIASNVAAMLQGARIVRVHDVRAAVDSVHMVAAILGWQEPVEVRHNVD